MRHIDISDKDREAIQKQELLEYNQKRLRGTGYDLMVDRDRGYGVIHDDMTNNQVAIQWNVEGGKEYPYQITESEDGTRIELYPRKVPEGMFVLRIGKEEAMIDKEAFQKLFRWV